MPYDIDDEGRVIDPSASSAFTPMTQRAMLGRVQGIDARAAQTILDWHGDDGGAEMVAVTVGYQRNLYSVADFQAGVPGDSKPGLKSFALIEFGVEGFSTFCLLDVFPEQTVVVPASFVRVGIFHFSDLPNMVPRQFYASVTRSPGRIAREGHYTERFIDRAPGAPFARAFVPPFAKYVKLNRNLTFPNAGMGAVNIDWRDDAGNIIQQNIFAAGVDVPEILVPGNAFQLSMINQEAVNHQDFYPTWYIEP